MADTLFQLQSKDADEGAMINEVPGLTILYILFTCTNSKEKSAYENIEELMGSFALLIPEVCMMANITGQRKRKVCNCLN